MATSTANTILKYGTTKGGTFEKLVDITGYPDLGATPNKLDTTDLTATKFKTSILGLQEVPDLEFEANYTLADYTLIDGLEGTHWFNLEMGDAGEDGVFEWSGEVSVYKNGGGVDEVRKMTIVLSAETEIELI
jgi:hypothetical protein